MKRNLHNTMIGQLLKQGKKNIATNILNTGLFTTAQKSSFSLLKILKTVAKKLGTIVETKTVRLRKNVHIIPFPLKKARRFYLISKNLTSSMNENKSKISFSNKLAEEMYSLIKNKQSKSLKKKENLLKNATQNKGNIHFRW